MEPFLIAVWGLASFVLCVFFGAREYNHKVRMESLVRANILEEERHLESNRNALDNMHYAQDGLRNVGFKLLKVEAELKQANIDITCFRAELGLPPRKLNRNAY